MNTATLPKAQRFITVGGVLLNTDDVKHVTPDGTATNTVRVTFISGGYLLVPGVKVDEVRAMLNGDPF